MVFIYVKLHRLSVDAGDSPANRMQSRIHRIYGKNLIPESGSLPREFGSKSNPDRNPGSASPYPETLWPSSLLPETSSPAGQRHASAPPPTAGKWNRGACPAPSWPGQLLRYRRTFLV